MVRARLTAGGKWIRTIGPPRDVVDPSGSRRDHRAKYGCLSARPRVRCLCPPGKTQRLLPKSVFDRPGLIAGTWHRPLFLTIAVGTPITGRPPHRTVRAAFLHTAPTSDV